MIATQTSIIRFYKNNHKIYVAPFGRFYTLNDIINESDWWWETSHTSIQWTFPLKEKSEHNSNAPQLTNDDIAFFRQDDDFQLLFNKSFVRFINFCGLDFCDNPFPVIFRGSNFDTKIGNVWGKPNHNWKRISRVLGSLSLLDRENKNQALFSFLRHNILENNLVTKQSFEFWEKQNELGK